MYSALAIAHRFQFVPPVLASEEHPLMLRAPRGLFSIDRRYDPEEPHYIRPHEGIDLWGPVKSPVFAAQRGVVLRVQQPTKKHPGIGNVYIAHTAKDPGLGDTPTRGAGFVTRYLHIRPRKKPEKLKPGDEVGAGERIGQIHGHGYKHLHFELWLVTNPDDPTLFWRREHSVAVDPTRIMYDWEAKLARETPTASEAQPIMEVGVVSYARIKMFQIVWGGGTYVIPLYEPTTDELTMVSLLGDAFLRGHPVRIASRPTHFFGKNEGYDAPKGNQVKDFFEYARSVITAVRVVGS